MPPRAVGHADHVVEKSRGDRQAGDLVLNTSEGLKVEQRAIEVEVVMRAVDGGLQDANFIGGGGIPDTEFHGEAVELSFGERIGAVLVAGILRGDDEEAGTERTADGRRR